MNDTRNQTGKILNSIGPISDLYTNNFLLILNILE